jgi:hypothetical protein
MKAESWKRRVGEREINGIRLINPLLGEPVPLKREARGGF